MALMLALLVVENQPSPDAGLILGFFGIGMVYLFLPKGYRDPGDIREPGVVVGMVTFSSFRSIRMINLVGV